MKTALFFVFLSLSVYISLGAGFVYDYPEIDENHFEKGIPSELLNVIDASSFSVEIDMSPDYVRQLLSSAGTGLPQDFQGEIPPVENVAVIKIAFIDYVIDPMAKMCIREAAVSFLRSALAGNAEIYFLPLSCEIEDGIYVFDSVAWIEAEESRIYLNSLLVYNKFATPSGVPEKYEFLFDFAEKRDNGKLKGRANF